MMLSEKTSDALLCAVEGVLAELGVTEPGAAMRNDNHEAPAAILLDYLYDCWNAAMREISETPDAVVEPRGFTDAELDALDKEERS